MKFFNQNAKGYVGLSILIVGFIYCLYLHFSIVNEIQPKGRKSILIAHWQGERGSREALQEVIDDYNKLHPESHVRQQIIVGYGSSFVRWCVTQIIGGSPPEIMEYHRGFRSYLGNYFIGLGEYVNQPNPYNKGTDYENIPWKDTFYGGMYGNWEPELMDYYSVPNTLYTQRFYYNKDIFRKATGSDKPPETMAEFIETCKKIEKLGIIPVIVENAKGTQGTTFFNLVISQIGWTFENELDFNHDGKIKHDEFMRGFYLNNFKFEDPRLQAGFTLMRDFSKTWGKGFNGIDFTVAPFMFIQQKGACYLGGSALGRQMLESCKFNLGCFPFPLVTSKNPIAGKYYSGPWGENTTQPGMSLAVANGPNKDIAIDFLRFLTTKKNNSTFNAGPAWVPGVIGAKINPAVKDFKPLIRGKNVNLGFAISSINIEFKRIMQNYLGGSCNKNQALEELSKVYRANGIKANQRLARDSQRRLVKIEEIMNDVNDQISHSASKITKEKSRKRLTSIYETKVYGLNPVYAVFGMDATRGEIK
jgi:raffinose/stachyose/melibiose transport system substrate-binding protein